LNRKGLANPHVAPENQPKDGEQTREAPEPGEAPPAEPAGDVSRDALFKDPYKVLAEIAGEADPSGEGYSTGGANGAGGAGTDATREFRDPFDPFFAESSNVNSGVAVETAAASETLRPTLAAPEQEKSAVSTDEPVEALAAVRTDGEVAPTPTPTQGGALPTSPPEDGARSPAPVVPPAPEKEPASSEWKELAAELTEAVEENSGSRRAPGVAVEETGEGVMISLTDDADFGMFDIGSAEPQPELVRIMEKVAAILKEQGGVITIRGHTDGRPFRTAAYDNWRLSTDRAQMAYYMLVRGGLDEHRVEAIEGYADRKLKVPGDPDAAENRRIEILLRGVTL
jgi:chemotaxis protein MotB